MKHGRGKLEMAISHYLADNGDGGWGFPSLRLQRAAFAGVTPAKANKEGRGRGSSILDLGKEDGSSGILCAKACSLKAHAERPTTVTLTTGRPEHIRSVVEACQNGRRYPVFVVVVEACIIDENGRFVATDGIQICHLDIGNIFSVYGLEKATEGQGRGRGQASALAWRPKTQTARSGKVYEYVSLQVNIAVAGGEWQRMNDLDDLAKFVEEKSEEIYL